MKSLNDIEVVNPRYAGATPGDVALGRPITRSGIRQLVERCAAKATARAPSLNSKKIGPHVLRHYIDGSTMSGTTGPRTILNRDCRSVGDRLTRLPDIVLADLQAAEKAEQPITGPVAAGLAGWRCCPGECLLLHCQRRLQIDLGGLDRFVSEPQGDHRAIDTCLKKVHGRRVSQAVDSDPLMVQRGASR